MMAGDHADIGEILSRLDEIELGQGALSREAAVVIAAEQLAMAEAVVEVWVIAHDQTPTLQDKEGFRLLALHAQAARGEPSFNACRETCREAVYQHNVAVAAQAPEEAVAAVRLMTMVVRHLALFVSGKLEVAGLGDFCCASRPLREGRDSVPASPAL